MYFLRHHIAEPVLLLFIWLLLHQGAENYALRAADANSEKQIVSAARSVQVLSAPSQASRAAIVPAAATKRNLKPAHAFVPVRETEPHYDRSASPLPADAGVGIPDLLLFSALHPRAPPLS